LSCFNLVKGVKLTQACLL